MKNTDSTIVRLCAEGDATARATIYNRYATKMWRLALRYVGDASVAWDVLHDVFLVAFTQINQLRRADSLEAWLMQLTRNAALLYLRAQEQRRRLFVEEDEEKAAQILTEEERADGAAVPTMEELLELVEQLPAGYRNVFKLAVLDGLSHEEVAQRLGISPHSSSSQLLRARRLLMRWITDRRVRAVLLLLLCSAPAGIYFYRLSQEEEQSIGETVSQPTNKQQEQQSEDRRVSNKQPLPPAPIAQHAETDSATMSCPTAPSHSSTPTPHYILTPADTVTLQPNEPANYAQSSDSITSKPDEKKNVPNVPQDFNKSTAEELPSSQLHNFKTSQLNAASWQLTAYVSGQAAASDGYPVTYQFLDNSTDSSVEDIFIKATTWEAVNDYFRNNAAASSAEQALADVAILNSGEIREQVHHCPTFTVALNLSHRLNDHWRVGGGLSYSLQRSDFTRGSNIAHIQTRQRVHDLGFTLRGEYLFLRPLNDLSTSRLHNFFNVRDRLTLSVGLDATLYVPLNATRTYSIQTPALSRTTSPEHFHVPLSFSPAISLGIHYRLTPHVDFTIAPALRYNFAPSNYPTTIRTAHPFNFSLPLGFTLEF